MIDEKKGNGCRIFCIFFENKIPGFNNEVEGNAKDILKQIAKLGETGDYYNSNSLSSLYNIFNKISNSIQTNYKLKLYN